MIDPYSPEVRRLFAAPAHAGRLDHALVATAGDADARIQLYARIENGHIAAMRFLARGCPHLVAAAEATCRALEGRKVVEFSDFDASGIRDRLAVPVEKTGRILLLEDAVRALGQQTGGATGRKPPQEH